MFNAKIIICSVCFGLSMGKAAKLEPLFIGLLSMGISILLTMIFGIK